MRDERCDAECCPPRRSGRRHGLGTAVVGLGLLGLGAVLTLDNLDLVDAHRILPWWPALLVLLGVSHLLQRSYLAGALWSLVGAVVLAANLDLVSARVWDLWPLVLVLVGGNLLWGVLRGRRKVIADAADSFSATAVLGGVTRRITAQDFSGGSAMALMGGCEVDLTGCPGDGGAAEIFAFAMWGGVDIKVPEDWEVRMEGAALLGGFEDSRERSAVGASRKVLTVRGIAIMGGVEVKS